MVHQVVLLALEAVQVDGKLSGTRLFHPLADMKEIGEVLYGTEPVPHA